MRPHTSSSVKFICELGVLLSDVCIQQVASSVAHKTAFVGRSPGHGLLALIHKQWRRQDFCRAILCTSAAHAVVRRLSVTFVYCVQTAKYTAIVTMERE